MRVAKLAIVVLCCATLVSVCCAQTTSVTFQVVDTDGQSWNNGSWTAQLAMPSGQQPPQFLIAGTNTVVPNQFQSAGMNGTGNGSLILTPNASIAPGGSQWIFNFVPLATPAQSYQQAYTISGTTQVLTVIPPGIRVSVGTPVIRALAYLDLEVTGGNLGSTYFNLTDSSIHLCSTFSSNTCTWTVGSGSGINIGGDLFAISGTQQEVVGILNHALPPLSVGFLQWNGANLLFSTPGGVISGLTPGFLPKSLTSTTIGNSLYDDAVTTPNTGTYGGTGGFATPNGPFSVGTPPTACGSAPDCIAFGQTATAGTPTASQNYIKSTASGFVCSVGTGAETPCIIVPVTGVTANGGLVLTGTTVGLLLTCTDKQVLAWVNGTSTWTCTTLLSQGGGGLPASPQNGDTIRYNTNGDTSWDLVNAAFKTGIIYTIVTNTTTSINSGGVSASLATLGTLSAVVPTAIDSAGVKLTSASSSASVNSVIGFNEGAGTSTGRYSFGSLYRWTARFAAQQTTNVRYWMGLTVFNNLSGGGCETIGQLSSTKFATDAPNCSTIGFRYSATTDTTWKATTQVTGGSQTVVDTTIAIDTNPHTFEYTHDGTTARFFIDGTLVASITTNLPTTSTANAVMFMTGDNKNTANSVSGTLYHVLYSLK